MSGELMNTKEVAQYLGIHEKHVYALVKGKRIPATRITGKWVFPRKLIDAWIESSARSGMEEARRKTRRIAGALLASGSNDPILDILHTYMRKRYPELYLFSTNLGSSDGLKALDRGFTDVAWSHLFDPETGEYNVPFLSTHLPNVNPVVVNLFHRDLGLIAAPENPLKIKGFDDLTREQVRLINRQSGSGTRVLLDYNLDKMGIPRASIRGYEREVYTHFEVGLAILGKDADVGLATVAVSKLLGLSFIPVTRESFDMILDRSTFFDKGIQSLIDTITSKEFRRRVAPLGSYDFTNSGKILYASQ